MSEPSSGADSAGSLLRAAREKQGLHIAALAAAIKVAPRKLDALENDRWNELPDATFTRALAQTVCRTLKIDARPVLDLLPPPGAVALEPASSTLNMPFQDRPGRDDGGFAGAAVRPMIWAAALLMLAAVAVYFVPDSVWSSGARQAPAPAGPASAAAPVPAAAVAPAIEPAGVAEAASGPASQALVAAPQPASASAPLPSRGETVFSAPPPTSTDAAAPTGIVQLRTSEASWVEVRDATGQVLLSRTVLPGEGVGLDGKPPLRVTIGNAAVTQLGFRGKPVDLAAHTRDNVVRIELQ
jgi:cytoskeleton protein RodZ